MANAVPLEIYRGIMTYNTIALYSNGTKKRFTGFIIVADEHGNETSYKINSFRSQVIIQSETLGERGMKGMHCTVHGNFKENTWNGETKWELMAEKIILDGQEQLAADAEAAVRPMPTAPPGTLPSSPGASPMVPQTATPIPVQPIYNMPAAPAAIPGTVAGSMAPVAAPNIPAPTANAGYIYNPAVSAPQAMNPVAAAPAAIPVVAGGYVYNPAAHVAPAQAAYVTPPAITTPMAAPAVPQTPLAPNVAAPAVPQTPLNKAEVTRKTKVVEEEELPDAPDPI
jgi:hypothetical protein